MKKVLLLFLLVLTSLLSYSQKKRKTLSEDKIGPLYCQYTAVVDLDTKDSLTYVYIGFQNKKYSAITDITSIIFDVSNDTAVLAAFVKDLKTAIGEMGSKQSISWDRDSYALDLYDFSKDLYIKEPKSKGTGYTTLSKSNAEKLLKWLQEAGLAN